MANFEKLPMTMNEALKTIHGLYNDDMQTARMDSEKDRYADILRRLGEGKITPAEAVLEAQRFSNGRQEGGVTGFEDF